MTACHIVPGELGTWKAKPTSARLPTDGLDSVSHLAHPASLYQSGGCEECNHAPQQLGARSDCHIPCPGIGSVAAPQLEPDAAPPQRPGWQPVVWCHARWLPPPQPRAVRHRL